MPRPDSTRRPYESKLYYEFAGFYDLVFGPLFYPRIAHVIRSLNIPPGARVLELGVGTGLSLRAYPHHCRMVGVDLARDMLEHAQEKIDRNAWRHLQVMQMDATALDFPDASFDYVMAFHVASVVSDAARLMREAHRVCVPGGTIVVINHFRSEKRMLAELDRRLEPLTRRLGWRTLRKVDVFDGVPLVLDRIYKIPRRSLFTVVVARTGGQDSAARAGTVSAGSPFMGSDPINRH